VTHSENEFLTRIGPGTPMGSLLRQYWIPALQSTDLPEPDGTPLRVRLLGENLVAFRNSDGKVGLIEIALSLSRLEIRHRRSLRRRA
jgi:phthalate 4,5-dioxygenase oxygenase subunit